MSDGLFPDQSKPLKRWQGGKDTKRIRSAISRKTDGDWHGDVDEEERYGRLTTQCRAILDSLRLCKCSNRFLATIALKYTSRISDLRAAGYDVRCVERSRKKGRTTYQLFEGESDA